MIVVVRVVGNDNHEVTVEGILVLAMIITVIVVGFFTDESR